MPIDVPKVLGYQFKQVEFRYDERDVSLYGLSIGIGDNPVDPEELKFVYEMNGAGFLPFPTMPVIFPFPMMWQILDVPGLDFNPMLLLHGEQYLEVKRPLPTKATITTRAHISQIYDKGSGALIYLDVSSADESGTEVAFNQISVFIRGLGGFGGERGPSGKINLPPETLPEAIHSQATHSNQALLYRLASRDGNPLHADPQMAVMGGFQQPILHGLCTFGYAVRAVLREFGNNDPARLKSVKARFSKHFFPGETVQTEMWSESETRIIFQVRAAERDELVITNAAVELNET